MYVTLITVTFFVLFKIHLNEGRVTGRFRRETSQPHIEAIYNRYKQQSHGEATYYGNYPGRGACSLDPLSPLASQPGWIRVAAGREDFQNSLGCGMCLEITGTGKGKGTSPVTGTLRGIIHDLCGGCKQGDLDLYIPGDGRWEISFKAINCPTVDGSNGNIMMRFTGSNPWYIKLQARNTRVPVAGIEVLKNGKYSCLKRVNDNYFVGDGLGKVDFPMQVRLTAVTGEQREAIIPDMKNDQDTFTDIQFTGHETGGGPSVIKCMGQGNKPPYPSGGVEPGSTGGSPGQPITGPSPAPAPAPAPPTYPPRPENANFCKQRKGGTYADPDRCSGFIICNIGNTHRMTCGDGLLFNANSMNCDLPQRVDCSDRPLDSPKGTNHHDDIQGQFSDPIQEIMAHGKPFKMHAEESVGNRVGINGRKGNESLPLGEGFSGGDTKSTGNPRLKTEHGSSAEKQPLKAVELGGHELHDKMEADETNVSPSIQLGLDFAENRKDEKADDSTQNDSKAHAQATNPKEPVLHVLINGGKNLNHVTSSSFKSDDEAGTSRPSFQIMVNKDSIKASLANSEGERVKMNDDSHGEADAAKQPKHTFQLVINNEHRKRVGDEAESTTNSKVLKQEGVAGEDEGRIAKPNFEQTINNKDQVIKQGDQRQKELENHGNKGDQPDQDNSKEDENMAHDSRQTSDHLYGIQSLNTDGSPAKNQEIDLSKPNVNEGKKIEESLKDQHLNGANKEKEPGMDIELFPFMPLHDQLLPSNASQNTKTMNAKNNDNVVVKRPVTMRNGMSEAVVQGEENSGKKGTQSNMQKDDQNVAASQKTKDEETTVKQQPSHPSNVTKILKPLSLPVTKTAPLVNHQEGLTFKPPQNVFKRPLEPLTYENQPQVIAKEKLREENEKSPKLQDSANKEVFGTNSETKANEPNTEKESEKPEKALDSSGVGPQPKVEDQGNAKRPTVDILLNGDSGRTTELRMRNSNNEIAGLSDASGKQAANRNPVIGITIRQKGVPDHHILFSKRQRLSDEKHRHRHHHHHKHH